MKILDYIKYDFLARKLQKEYGYDRPKYEDRNVLERIIIPRLLARLNPQAILDIGREDYQSFYNLYFEGRELWSLDIDPKRREFGAENHITADAANVGELFEKDKFDLVLMNGVINWGLNDPKKIEKSLNGVYDIMKKDGILVIGWNDFKDIRIIRPEEIKALSKFQPYYFKPLKGTAFKCINGEHNYNFYIK